MRLHEDSTPVSLEETNTHSTTLQQLPLVEIAHYHRKHLSIVPLQKCLNGIQTAPTHVISIPMLGAEAIQGAHRTNDTHSLTLTRSHAHLRQPPSTCTQHSTLRRRRVRHSRRLWRRQSCSSIEIQRRMSLAPVRNQTPLAPIRSVAGLSMSTVSRAAPWRRNVSTR